MSRSRVTFLAWAPTAGRARDLAAALGGEARTVYPARLASRRLTPARYAASAVLTVGELVRRRPRAVVVQNPPVYPSLLALAYARVARARFVLDNHPTSFGAKDNAQARRTLGITTWLARQADAVLVTTPSWADVVAGWGGRGVVLHEAPPRWTVPAAQPLGSRRPRILFSCVFASDEPVREVVEAARRVPEVDVVVTGDPRRAPDGLVDSLPVNVSLTGWLDQDAYAAEVARCDVLLALTDEPTSVMRAAYEAAFAGRPLLMSDTPVMRAVFPRAAVTDLDVDSLTVAFASVPVDHDRLLAAVPETRADAVRAWEEQQVVLRRVLGLDEPAGVLQAPFSRTDVADDVPTPSAKVSHR